MSETLKSHLFGLSHSTLMVRTSCESESWADTRKIGEPEGVSSARVTDEGAETVGDLLTF